MNTHAHPLKLNLESLYLATPVKLGEDGPGARSFRLTIASGAESSELSGTLQLDPNTCTLSAFGDREGCTKMAIRSFEVKVTLQRLGDPKNLHRSFYAVRGEGLPHDLALIMYPHRERVYLKCQSDLVALFPEDGA